MSKAVQFDSYGGIDVLQARDVPRPVPQAGEVLVEVKAAGMNPSEAVIRSGALEYLWPTTFPSGQGSDLAGVVAELGRDVSAFAIGDEVIGFSMRRSSHAEYVTVPASQLTPRPANVPWEVAGSLFVAGCTAYAAVRAVRLKPGDTVAIAGAAGGVGSIAVQLARRAGATVLGIAGPSNDIWLADHSVIPVNYGDHLPARLRAAAPSGRIDALLDFFGGGYVAMAVDDLKLRLDRIDTIADFEAVKKFGVQSIGGAALTKPTKRMSKYELTFANGSEIVGIPGGADQIRSYHPWGYLLDEAAFVPDAGECYNTALAAAKGSIILNSSAGPGWFADAKRDIIKVSGDR
jgi:NADPH:quinone reductase-like Zn-dependent oxidoreductase